MSIQERFIFPIKPSPHDSRDHVFEHVRPRIARINRRGKERSLPTELDLSEYLNAPRDQGRRGTCVAFSCGAIKECHERKDVNYNGYFAPDSVYFYRENKPEEGMYLRDAMKLLYNQGMAREDKFPYDGTQEPEAVPEAALEDMPKFKIKQYAQVNTIDGLKRALATEGPCLIAFPVYDGNPEFWRASSRDSPMYGGHCVCVVGYNKEGFIIRNSWGDDWNGNGKVLYPYSDWGMHWEIWSCIDEDSDAWFPNDDGGNGVPINCKCM